MPFGYIHVNIALRQIHRNFVEFMLPLLMPLPNSSAYSVRLRTQTVSWHSVRHDKIIKYENNINIY